MNWHNYFLLLIFNNLDNCQKIDRHLQLPDYSQQHHHYYHGIEPPQICMYTDSIIHDFSNSYDEEIEPLKNEIKQLLSQTEEIESSPLLKIFGKLSVLRLDNSTDKLQSLESLYDELEQMDNAIKFMQEYIKTNDRYQSHYCLGGYYWKYND